MDWHHYVAWFIGWLLMANALPHLLSGMMGRAFQSPFASPPGRGLSSSSVNVLWGAANLIPGYLLVCHVGTFNLRRIDHGAVAALAWVGFSLFLARYFGRFHGGNSPLSPRAGTDPNGDNQSA